MRRVKPAASTNDRTIASHRSRAWRRGIGHGRRMSGSGDRWLLLHGTPLTPAAWDGVAACLTRSGTVLAPAITPAGDARDAQGALAARLTAGVARPAGRLPVAGHSFGGPVAPPPSGSGHAHRGRTRPGVHPGSHVSPGQPPAQGCPDDPARRRAHDTLHRSSRPGRAHPPRRRAMITRAGRAREGAPAQRRPVSGLRRCCQLSVGEAAGCCIYLIP